MFKKWDIIIIIFLICLLFILEIIFGVVMGKNYNGIYVEIILDGKFYKKIFLLEYRGKEEFDIKIKYGYNEVEIND